MPLNPNDFPDQGGNGVATLDPSSFPDQAQGSALDPTSFPDQGKGGDIPLTTQALRNAGQAAKELVMGMIPKTPMQYAASVFPPLAAFEQGKALAQGDISSIPIAGRVPEIIQAEKTPAFSKERFLTAGKTLMDLGLLAGAGAPEAKVGGEQYAKQPSYAQVQEGDIALGEQARPEGEVPKPSDSDYAQREAQGAAGEGPQPRPTGEPMAPTAQEPTYAPGAGVGEIAEPAAVQPPAEPVGANVKSFEKIYGVGEIPAGESVSPEEAWNAAAERARTGKAKPYDYVQRAQQGAITPDEMGDLIYEHQRLVNEAAAAEGTPQYEELYNRARTFSENVVKPAENAWHRQGMTMQIKQPIDYSNLTGFRQALEQRFGREMRPEEEPSFKKIASEIDGAKRAARQSGADTWGKAAKRMSKVKDISWEDAIKQMHDAITEATKPCKL